MQSIFILLLTLGCISIVSTYQCYTCTGGLEIDCNDPFNKNGMTDANKEEAPPGSVCMKSKIKAGDVTVVTRSVNPLVTLCVGGQNGCKETTQGGGSVTICCCTSNLCNGVSTVQQKPLIVLLTMSTLAMFTYRWC